MKIWCRLSGCHPLHLPFGFRFRLPRIALTGHAKLSIRCSNYFIAAFQRAGQCRFGHTSSISMRCHVCLETGLRPLKASSTHECPCSNAICNVLMSVCPNSAKMRRLKSPGTGLDNLTSFARNRFLFGSTIVMLVALVANPAANRLDDSPIGMPLSIDVALAASYDARFRDDALAILRAHPRTLVTLPFAQE